MLIPVDRYSAFVHHLLQSLVASASKARGHKIRGPIDRMTLQDHPLLPMTDLTLPTIGTRSIKKLFFTHGESQSSRQTVRQSSNGGQTSRHFFAVAHDADKIKIKIQIALITSPPAFRIDLRHSSGIRKKHFDRSRSSSPLDRTIPKRKESPDHRLDT